MTLPPEAFDPATIRPAEQSAPFSLGVRLELRGEFPEPIGENVEENSFEKLPQLPRGSTPAETAQAGTKRSDSGRNEQLPIEAVRMN